jgi:histidine triad (HIT) family protein
MGLGGLIYRGLLYCFDMMIPMQDTIFTKVINDEIPNYKVWENDEFLAFLTPYPNTPGLTVVIPKQNPGDYVFEIDDELYTRFLLATKKVAEIIKVALGVARVALVFEGTGVAHVHAKLYPLHGPLASQTDVWSAHTEFSEEYKGHFSTVEGPEMSDSRLKEIQQKILNVQK